MNELKNNIAERSLSQVARVSVTQEPKADQNNLSSGKVSPEVSAVETAVFNDEKVREAVSRINEYVQQTQRTLDFQLDESSGKTIIRVYDKLSSEMIRQIPSELALELAQKLNDEEPSLLFSAQV
ncbi:MAG: flagellar biosynthesis protein FlaG [Oceanospirillaceae bacterium]|nr:flagellar biosynthesis protein FlaG [Oceanospirillaceae bacterium]|tara:strand:- start:1872 stop:2246 length:375 start_codon:yes stop_codon:yes gene_type:complete